MTTTNSIKSDLKPTILFIVGSLREKSFNKQLAEEARNIVGDRANTPMLEWDDVPVFNQDKEFPAPESVERVRTAVSEADAIWFVTPEYNHSMPGGFKNLIDWLSRPIQDGSPAVIMKKTATYSAFSGGSCGRYVLSAVIPTFEYLQLDLIKIPPTSGGFNRQEFDTSILDVTDTMRADISRQAEALLKHLNE